MNNQLFFNKKREQTLHWNHQFSNWFFYHRYSIFLVWPWPPFNPLTKLHVIKNRFWTVHIQVIQAIANLLLETCHCIENDTLVWARTLHIIWINMWFWVACNYSNPSLQFFFLFFFNFSIALRPITICTQRISIQYI